MSQISKCPTLRVVLGYWEALGEVSEMRYNNLLYISSKRSYCSTTLYDTYNARIANLANVAHVVNMANMVNMANLAYMANKDLYKLCE